MLFRYQSHLPEILLFAPNRLELGLGYKLLAAGLLVAGAALQGYDLAEFAGWAYVRRDLAAAGSPLRTDGLNRLVRHPLYLGLLLGLLGFWLLAPIPCAACFQGATWGICWWAPNWRSAS